MVREISAGGVVVRHKDGEWWMAAIELPGEQAPKPDSGPDTAEPEVGASKRKVRPKAKIVLCLPKGLVDPGEKALEAALREVREETGIMAALVTKLADIKYVYVRTWSDGERVFKIVSFYLLHYESGKIDDISDEMRIEVARAKWVRLEEAPKLLSYRGEKQMARKAAEYLKEHLEIRGEDFYRGNS
jgi:8-oxo-dGTP pyrophosphatase MutT (NUDIX family)